MSDNVFRRVLLPFVLAWCFVAPGAMAQSRGVTITGPATAESETLELGRYHALVIGNDRYAHLPALKTAAADAAAVASLLEGRYAFAGVRLLLDASRADIFTALNAYRRELEDRDRLLIYYLSLIHI